MYRTSRLIMLCIPCVFAALLLGCRNDQTVVVVVPNQNSATIENLSVDPEEDELPRRPMRKTGRVALTCEFDDGWYAILPKELAGEQGQDEFLMQALIGLTEEPDFWASMAEYQKLKPHAAQRCGTEQVTRDVQPGSYVLFIGWAGQYERTGYENNGRIESLTVAAGEDIERRITTADLDADLPCISCPFLLVARAGQFVELGQILIDRYLPSKQGTDRRQTIAEVVGGQITVKLAEREPEVSHIDAVEVWYRGQKLQPVGTSPTAARAIDGSAHTLATGDELTMHFQAPVRSGDLEIEIRVNGYYILDRARRP